jgi:hypothetical protein
MLNLNSTKLKSVFYRYVLNFRILAYCVTLSYLFMHYFVSFDKLKNETGSFQLDVFRPPESSLIRINKTSASGLSKNILINKLLSNLKSHAGENSSSKKNEKYILRRKDSLLKFDVPFKRRQLFSQFSNYSPQRFYNLKIKNSTFYSQIMQDKILVHLLNTSYLNNLNASFNGFFVEAGAFDGESWSNTLHLERFKNWTGLLIEPSLENYKLLKSKNRNAYSINSCISKGSSSVNSSYIEAGPFGITANVSSETTVNTPDRSLSTYIYNVVCHPLAKILDSLFEQFPHLKIRNSHIRPMEKLNTDKEKFVIDYMSLDIEGNEKEILESFPWNKYKFNFLNIECNKRANLCAKIKQLMLTFGYRETIIDDVWYQDLYLAHESIYDLLNLSRKLVSQFA